MHANAVARPFSRPGWLFELKYDGFRVLAVKEDGRSRLLSRSGRDMAKSFPELVAALERLPNLALDGELVVCDAAGRPQFQQLRRRALRTKHLAEAVAAMPACIYAFDLLALKGEDLRARPLIDRKRLLKRTLGRSERIRYLDHVDEHGEALYAEIERLELEGMVAKDAASMYRPGRSHAWLKVKTPAARDIERNRLRHLNP